MTTCTTAPTGTGYPSATLLDLGRLGRWGLQPFLL
jgi:hypothetical protein